MHDNAELDRYKHYFDTVEKLPLTQEQRKAAVCMADRSLLVAAAGSGKTSTIVAKVGYALRTGCYAPNRILVLAFNQKAAQELHQRIHQCLQGLLPQGQCVHTKTFHALGLNIIAAVQGKQPGLRSAVAAKDGDDTAPLKQLIKDCLDQQSGFAQEWMLFRMFYCRDIRDPARFPTRKLRQAFQHKQGNGYGRKPGFLSFTGDLVSSQCLQAIANWLYLHGCNYRYSNTGPYRWLFWLGMSTPGFFLPDAQLWVLVPDSAKVAHKLKWRQQNKADCHRVLVLSFDDFVSGRLFAQLHRALSGQGYAVSAPNTDLLLQRLGNQPSQEELLFLRDFIQHARDNGIHQSMLREQAQGHDQAERAGVLVNFLGMLLQAHEGQLQQSEYIDFQEMLDRASRYVVDGKYQHTYDLILVDEFQDTSQSSARLIQALLLQHPSCKLFAVGDDWQSIYRFAGADCSLFTGFHRYFGDGVVNYLSASFRFNQGIADVATKFILRNPEQIPKRVQAYRPKAQGSVSIYWYHKPDEMVAACSAGLADISRMALGQDRSSVYLLGRYHHQQPVQLATWQAAYPSLHIQFKTIHAAKGLEADFVLVLGLHAGPYAFPSRLYNDALLHLVMPAAEAWPDAEERRLLYVALTRARHKVLLIASAAIPSDFITELSSDPDVHQVDWLSGQLPLAASRF